jgi:hypothetical protein
MGSVFLHIWYKLLIVQVSCVLKELSKILNLSDWYVPTRMGCSKEPKFDFWYEQLLIIFYSLHGQTLNDQDIKKSYRSNFLYVCLSLMFNHL